MGFFKKMSEYLKRSKNSDLKRVRVTSSGAFYMKSEDLFKFVLLVNSFNSFSN